MQANRSSNRNCFGERQFYGPNRSFDQFQDDQVMPRGKVLEVVTIDAAWTIGMEAEICSLDVGKQADVMLLDLRKPRLAPGNMRSIAPLVSSMALI